MEWYGWVLLVVAIIAVVAFIITLVAKSRPIVRGLTDEEEEALIKNEKTRVAKELEAEKLKNEKLEKLARDLENSMKMLQLWYEDAKNGIEESRKIEFETYLGDPNRAGSELDKLLGIESRDQKDKTEPG